MKTQRSPLMSGLVAVLIFATSSTVYQSTAIAGVVFTTNYTAAEGFSNAPLRNNPDWVGGPNVAVRPGTTGFVRNGNVASDLPTYNLHGALSTSGATSFRRGDQIKINTYIQFDLPGSEFAQEIARFGFSGSANSPVLEHGFGIVWDKGRNNDPSDSGSLRFFPDFNDYEYSEAFRLENLYNSETIPGRAAGLDVFDTMGAGVDTRSNMFDVSYTVEKTGAANQWSIKELSIINLSRAQFNRFSYNFGTLVQLIDFSGPDAFFGQRLAVRGQNRANAIARSEYVTFSFNPANPVVVPEPSSLAIAVVFSICGYVPRRRRLA